MTSTGILPPEIRNDLRSLLRERAGEWLARFYRHEILVARTVRGMQVEAVEEFNRAVVNPLLKAIGGSLSTFTPRGSDLIPEAFPEIQALRREIDATVARGSDAVRRLTETRMGEIARQEVRWTSESARKLDPAFGSVSMPAEAKVVEQVLARPILGAKVEKVFQSMLATPTADAVRAWVNTGIVQGLTTDEIVKGLRGTAEQVGILGDKPSYAVAALVRTAATHASTVSRAESFKAIGATHYQFVATLDSRTSIQCASLDGKVFELGKGPLPPLHPSCRSTVIPDFDGSANEGTRASIDGQVPGDQTFRGWLEGRSVAEQNEVLGRTKAEAWRSGKLTIERMLGADLQPLTLAELRDMDRL